MAEDPSKDSPQAKGGHARAVALTDEQRREIAKKAAAARWDSDLPVATHEGQFKLGESEIACAVLPNGTRVITQATFLRALGRSRSPKSGTGVLTTAEDGALPFFLQADALAPYISEDLRQSTAPIFYRSSAGAKGVGYDARILPQVAEVYLRFRDELLATKGHVAEKRYARLIGAADILMRGLAQVGIIALVDEATGFQRDRAKDALARILEKFIAKELRPWVRTFPDEFYEQLFRLRGMAYPRDAVKKPLYFGHLTNNIVYDRLAPAVREELLKKIPRMPSGKLKHHLHRGLSEDFGHPKLREHLASVITVMKLSDSFREFMAKLDRVHKKFGSTYDLPLDDADSQGFL